MSESGCRAESKNEESQRDVEDEEDKSDRLDVTSVNCEENKDSINPGSTHCGQLTGHHVPGDMDGVGCENVSGNEHTMCTSNNMSGDLTRGSIGDTNNCDSVKNAKCGISVSKNELCNENCNARETATNVDAGQFVTSEDKHNSFGETVCHTNESDTSVTVHSLKGDKSVVKRDMEQDSLSRLNDSRLNDSRLNDSRLNDSQSPSSREDSSSVSCGFTLIADTAPSDSTASESSSSTSHDFLQGAGNVGCAEDESQSFYNVKWVWFKEVKLPVVMQNENGPCPLIAIMNVLLLQRRITLPTTTDIITSAQIMTYLGDCIFENAAKNVAKELMANQEQNMHDAMTVFHRLQTGLDVNVRFTGVCDFEYTSETVIFDLLDIHLYHGWLVDPQESPEYLAAIGNCSYNQLVEKVVGYKSSSDTALITEALCAESFLEHSMSQLTYHGLCELATTVNDGQFSVFFRNNHFSTLYKHKGELFLLVTDQGFLLEPNVVWETLSNVEGDCHFVDANFRTYCKPDVPIDMDVTVGSDTQINNDYQLALSLQQEQQSCDTALTNPTIPMATSLPAISQTSHALYQQHQTQSDHELALKLQAESTQEARDILQPRNAALRTHAPQSVSTPSSTSSRNKSNSSCCLL